MAERERAVPLEEVRRLALATCQAALMFCPAEARPALVEALREAGAAALVDGEEPSSAVLAAVPIAAASVEAELAAERAARAGAEAEAARLRQEVRRLRREARDRGRREEAPAPVAPTVEEPVEPADAAQVSSGGHLPEREPVPEPVDESRLGEFAVGYVYRRPRPGSIMEMQF